MAASTDAVIATTTLLSLPDEILSDIAIICGPSAACKLSRTCKALHNIISSDATWKSFLAYFKYPGHAGIDASKAKETAQERYCKTCDSIVGPMGMFYTGNICISCEYSNPNEVWAQEPLA